MHAKGAFEKALGDGAEKKCSLLTEKNLRTRLNRLGWEGKAKEEHELVEHADREMWHFRSRNSCRNVEGEKVSRGKRGQTLGRERTQS